MTNGHCLADEALEQHDSLDVNSEWQYIAQSLALLVNMRPQMLAETYGRVRTSIVAFAEKYPVPSNPEDIPESALSRVFGTGFIVGDSIVATNRHVMDYFKNPPNPHKDTGEVPVVAILFTKTRGGMGACFLNVCNACYVSGVKSPGHTYATEPPDLALVLLGCRGLSKFALECASEPVSAGTEIATAGFPMGSDLFSPCGTIERLGPVLQRGIISAESPFQSVDPHCYLIDVMMQGGASGSPVFLPENGKVVGVVYASQPDHSVVKVGTHSMPLKLPTSFTYVVPSTILCKAMDASEKALASLLPSDAPLIDAIIDSMPQHPVKQITYSKFVGN